MLIRTMAIAAMAALSGAATAQVYRCPDASGRTLIQQVPCMGGERMNVAPASGHVDPQSESDGQRRLQKMKADNAMAEAIRRGIPVSGMTREQLRRTMGSLPDVVNPSDYDGMIKEQLVYYRSDATWYVYLTNGIVDAVQQRSASPGMAPAPRAGRCPTPHEIRNAEVSASSRSLSPEQARGLWRKVEDMRACR